MSVFPSDAEATDTPERVATTQLAQIVLCNSYNEGRLPAKLQFKGVALVNLGLVHAVPA